MSLLSFPPALALPARSWRLRGRSFMLAAVLLLAGPAQAQWVQRPLGLSRVSAISGQPGGLLWATGSGLAYRSLDGGQTWTNTGICRCAPVSLIALSPDTAWGMHITFPGYGGTHLIRTFDGGQTWQHFDRPAPGVIFPLAPSNRNLAILHFFDHRHAVAVGHNGQQETWWTTQDGGLTWQLPPPAPAVVPPSYLGPSAASGNRIWAAGHPYIYASYDRGHSWRKDSSGFSTTHVRGLAFRDTANGLACDDRNTLRRTTDGGRTWQPLPHQGDVYNRLQVIPGTSTYLSYNSLTLPTGPATNTTYSTDDGLTWHYFILPRTPDFLFFTTPSEGYFVELPNQFHAWSGGPFPQAVTGLPAEEASTEVRLWPNPTTGLSQLSSEHPLQHVRVLNTLGQSVWEAPASGQLTIEVNARHLSPGLYLLQTTDAAGIRRQLRLVRE